jgi:antitoxin component of RelBE/YafQ-DinJ toxin-antitoxin module
MGRPRKFNEPTKFVTAQIEYDLYDSVKAFAAERGMTVSDVIRLTLANVIEEEIIRRTDADDPRLWSVEKKLDHMGSPHRVADCDICPFIDESYEWTVKREQARERRAELRAKLDVAVDRRCEHGNPYPPSCPACCEQYGWDVNDNMLTLEKEINSDTGSPASGDEG